MHRSACLRECEELSDTYGSVHNAPLQCISSNSLPSVFAALCQHATGIESNELFVKDTASDMSRLETDILDALSSHTSDPILTVYEHCVDSVFYMDSTCQILKQQSSAGTARVLFQ
jgi:hypothetical protein